MDTQEKVLTFGEKAVGLTFNPSGDETVVKVKQLYAEIIDLLNDRKTPGFSESGRLLSIAITEAQGAQMWAVKAITWKDEAPVVPDAPAPAVEGGVLPTTQE